MAGAGTNVLDGWVWKVGREAAVELLVVSVSRVLFWLSWSPAGEEGSTEASRLCESRAWVKVCCTYEHTVSSGVRCRRGVHSPNPQTCSHRPHCSPPE